MRVILSTSFRHRILVHIGVRIDTLSPGLIADPSVTCIRPLRPCASCTVDTPRRARVSMAPASARWMLRTTVLFMGRF